MVLVINFKCPTYVEDYIHRIGRTARFGKKGCAINLTCDSTNGSLMEYYKKYSIQAIDLPVNFVNYMNWNDNTYCINN